MSATVREKVKGSGVWWVLCGEYCGENKNKPKNTSNKITVTYCNNNKMGD